MSNQHRKDFPIYGALRNEDLATSRSTALSECSRSAISNQYIDAATAGNTRKAYQCDVRQYEQWGGSLPATTDQIISYLHGHAPQLNHRTLMRRVTALRQWHIYQGFADPTDHPLVRKTLSGIANTHGKPKNKAPALSLEDLSQIINSIASDPSLSARRDNALLQVGFFGAFRRSELVSIKHESLNISKDGIEILIPRSKSDQKGDGQICALPYGNDDLCPITALNTWLETAEIATGVIFRKITRWGKVGESQLSPLTVNQVLKKRAMEAGIANAEILSSHSLRRGLATAACHSGASIKSIMGQGRWRHVNTVIGYIEDAQRFNDNAATAILKKEAK